MNRRRACCCGGGGPGPTFGDCLEFWEFCIGTGPARIEVEFQATSIYTVYAVCDDLTVTNQVIEETEINLSMSGSGRYEANGANVVLCGIPITGFGSADYKLRYQYNDPVFGSPCPNYVDCFEETGNMSGPVGGSVFYGNSTLSSPPFISVSLFFAGAPTATIVQRNVGLCGNSFQTFQTTGSGGASVQGKEEYCDIDPQTGQATVSFGTVIQNAPLVFQDSRTEYLGPSGYVVIRTSGQINYSVTA